MLRIKRTWKLCCNSYINNIYDDVWSYVSDEYDMYNQPNLYLNTSKSVHILGQYTYDLNARQGVISLNAEIVNHPEDVLNVIIHEICHHIANMKYNANCGHDYRWKKIAAHVGAHYGETITRLCEDNNATMTACERLKKPRKVSADKYMVKCDTCGTEWKFKRKSWWVEKLLNQHKDHKENICTCPKCKQHDFSAYEIG